MTGGVRAVSLVAGIAMALVAVGAPVLLMTVPAYTQALVMHVDAPGRAGLGEAETRELAEQVRAFVAGEPERALPATLPDGRPAFDEKAVSHLEDVRAVLAGARVATVVALAVALAALAWLVWSRRFRPLGVALAVACAMTTALTAVAVLLALLDFGWFFAAFHALFFEEGTWQFAPDALLIRLFPEPFWVVSGAVWGGLALLSAALMGLAARAMLGRRESEGGMTSG